MTTLDALRPAAADSFDRAAEMLRTASPRPARRRTAWAALGLLALAGACATPVETERTIGTTLSWTVYGSADPGHSTVQALDAVVPGPKRMALETRPAERPTVPEGDPDPPGATWTRVRYTTSVTHPDTLAQIQRAAIAVLGVYGLAVEPETRVRRVPFVAAATRSVRVALQPGAPGVGDHDLQAFIDAHLERMDLPADSEWRRHPPQIEQLDDGRRVLVLGPSAMVLTPETRLWTRPDDAQRPIDMHGVGYDGLLWRTKDGWKTPTELGHPEPDWEKLGP